MQSVPVSKDCLDILTHMLVAVPQDRLSMDAIKTHPWFLAGLPPGALDMNEFLLRGMEPFNLSMVRDRAHLTGCAGRLAMTRGACSCSWLGLVSDVQAMCWTAASWLPVCCDSP